MTKVIKLHQEFSKNYVQLFLVFIISQCLFSCKSDIQCACVRSQIYYSIENSIISDDIIDRINTCSNFLHEGATLSFKASHVLYQNGLIEQSKKYLHNSFKKGLNLSLLDYYDFDDGLIEEDPSFKRKIEAGNKFFTNNKLDKELYNLIDELYHLDQDIRIKGEVIINDSLITDMRSVDHYVFSTLYDHLLYDKLGEDIISVMGTYKLYIILLHNLTRTDEDTFSLISERLKRLIFSGKFNAQYLASIIDRREVQQNNSLPYYYEYNLDNLISNRPEITDSLRFSFGLTPLYLDRLKKEAFLTKPCNACF